MSAPKGINFRSNQHILLILLILFVNLSASLPSTDPYQDYEPCSVYPSTFNITTINITTLYSVTLVPHNSLMYMAVSGFPNDAFIMKQDGRTFVKAHSFFDSKNKTLKLSPDGEIAILYKRKILRYLFFK